MNKKMITKMRFAKTAFVSLGLGAMLALTPATAQLDQTADDELLEELTGESPNPKRNIGELGPIYIAALDKLSLALTSKSEIKRRSAHNAIKGMCNHVGNTGMDAQRRIFSSAFATKLEDTEYPAVGRQLLIRGLGDVGGSECVPTLVKLMEGDNPVEAELARMGLQNVPGDASGKALVKALKGASSKNLVLGLVDAVAARRLPDAVDAIAPLMKSEEPEVVLAASTALGQLGGSAATKALGAARKVAVDKKLQQEIELALIEIANQRGLSGDREGAGKIFKVLGEQTSSASVRTASMLGLARATPAKADQLVIDSIKSNDARTRAAGIMTATMVPGTRISKGLAAMLPSSTKDVQIQILNSLALKRDSIVLPEVLEFLESIEGKDKDLELAAVRAVGPLGSTGNVELLLRKGVSKVPSIRDAALQALGDLRGKDISKTIEFHAREGKEAEVRAVAIGMFMRDRDRTGLTRMMSFAKENNLVVSGAAFAVLRKEAGDGEFRGLLDLMEAGKNEAYGVIKSLCARSKNPDLLVGEIENRLRSSDQPRDQRFLLSCLPVLGSPRGMATLVKYADDEPVVAAAAKRALSQWPNEEALPEILRLMEAQSDDRSTISLMCAGIARLVPVAEKLTLSQKARYVTAAFSLAKTSRDKITLLPILGKIPDKDCAKIIEEMLTDRYSSAVAGSAAASISELMIKSDPDTARRLAKALREKGRFNSVIRSRAQRVLNEVGGGG